MKYFTIALCALAFASCEKPAEEVSDPVLEVNSTNIKGFWSLTEWNGVKLQDGLYFYLEFYRRDNKTYFKSYDNVSSNSARKETGYCTITVDDALGGAVIRGMLDYSMGKEWNNRYIVTDLTASRMVWTVVGNPSDVSVYERVASIPTEITGESAE